MVNLFTTYGILTGSFAASNSSLCNFACRVLKHKLNENFKWMNEGTGRKEGIWNIKFCLVIIILSFKVFDLSRFLLGLSDKFLGGKFQEHGFEFWVFCFKIPQESH